MTGVTTAWMQEVEQRMEQLPSEYPKGHKCGQQSSSLKGDGYKVPRSKPIGQHDAHAQPVGVGIVINQTFAITIEILQVTSEPGIDGE